MKNIILLPTLYFSIAIGTIFACDSPTQRLVEVELEYAAATALGFGKESSKLRGIQAELDVLRKAPEIKNENFWKILKQKKILLEAQKARVQAEGIANAHPASKKIEAQITTIIELEKTRRFDKS